MLGRSELLSSFISNCRTCLTTCVVKFRDLPPRIGFARQAAEKPRSFIQLDDDDGCCKTSRNSFVNRLAAAGRAPFGMCTISALYQTDKMFFAHLIWTRAACSYQGTRTLLVIGRLLVPAQPVLYEIRSRPPRVIRVCH